MRWHEMAAPSERIAYFSMEIHLHADIPTYAGGLGILAGDTLRSAADLELPLVGVTLVSRRGYFRQQLDPMGRQSASAQAWDPSRWTRRLGARVSVPIEGRDVWVAAWLFEVEGRFGQRRPVILLDTDVSENGAEDREITHELYGRDAAYRLRQEIVLGIGGVRMLHALGFSPVQYHLNEGHSALLTLQLLKQHAYPVDDVRTGESPYDIHRVRQLCNFTTHTPVDAGHDRFAYDLVERMLGDFFELPVLKLLAGEDGLNLTRLALNLSDQINGVAKRHAETSRRLFPGYHVTAITNGVHPYTWTAPPVARVFDAYLPGWCHEPEILTRADCCIPSAQLQQAHLEAKDALVALVQARCGVRLDRQHAILGFARRMTAYKRPDLLFSDLQRLRAIAARWPFALVMAGKAHPADTQGQALIEHVHACMRELAGHVPAVFIPDYDQSIAAAMVAGADLWLNTPLPPLEASGTSGMKAAFNGVPSLSVLDGWWVEGCIEGVTGWAIIDGDDRAGHARSLYTKLDDIILPLFYRDPAGYQDVMKGAIAKNASFFNSHRMMRRYVSDAYIR